MILIESVVLVRFEWLINIFTFSQDYYIQGVLNDIATINSTPLLNPQLWKVGGGNIGLQKALILLTQIDAFHNPAIFTFFFSTNFVQDCRIILEPVE